MKRLISGGFPGTLLADFLTMRALTCLALGSALLFGWSCGGETDNASSKLCPNSSEESPGSGTVKCDTGLVHRAARAECAPFVASDAVLPPTMQPDHDECHADADCSARAYGDCQPPESTYFKAHLWNFCVYGCTSDADCDAGSVCDCGSNGGLCRESTCTTDSDCDDGYCARFPAGCGYPGFACQSANDECTVASDCEAGFECTGKGGGPWRCVIWGCPG